MFACERVFLHWDLLLHFCLQPEAGADYQEDESDSETEEEDVFESPTTTQVKNTEHSNPNSYSWLILKLATLRVVQARLTDFLAVKELPSDPPNTHQRNYRLQAWRCPNYPWQVHSSTVLWGAWPTGKTISKCSWIAGKLRRNTFRVVSLKTPKDRPFRNTGQDCDFYLPFLIR